MDENIVFSIDVISAYKLAKEHFEWTEIEPLSVDRSWMDLAKEEGLIEVDRDYAWSNPDKVAARQLRGTHDCVWLLDKGKRTRRQVKYGNSVLVARTD